MKRFLVFFAAFLVLSFNAPAQDAAAPASPAVNPSVPAAAKKAGASGAGMEGRLAKAMKMFPEADLDKDGKLSMDEAMKYLQLHPELKETLAARAPGAAEKNKGTSSLPPVRSTSEALPPGPRVFVCAHSFMIYTAKMLPPMAEAAGIGWRSAGQQMIGGSQVIQHWNLPDDRNLAKKTLTAGTADVITFSPHILLPDEGIDNFTKLGLEHNPKLRILIQASWPARDGDLDGTKGFAAEQRDAATLASLQEMQDSFHQTWLTPLEAQVHKLNTAAGHEALHIVPAGDAVMALRKLAVQGQAPGIVHQTQLFRDTLGHPQAPIAALVTYCHFACILGRNPAGLPVPEDLKSFPHAEELNQLLQKIAWETVINYPMSGVTAETKVAAK